ncbi:hypothetical protein J437_LFUL007947 [Ladona fulva]|uniref:cGMP-dependent protein kinase N-terminal coiled-coil domain-containing protein n=1 Tax=Ladona fulva TaxID=123851 RepID=A0A8K0KEC9_LADFU|nr:hypothetical protein J437_LFUL007947 [Ladona fulva]
MSASLDGGLSAGVASVLLFANDTEDGSRMHLDAKDFRIRELEEKLMAREQEILELRSQLDKFQSVMCFHGGSGLGRPRKRAQGISAEPQSQSTMQELIQKKFPLYGKENR